jgi:molybdenum cofactor cytidylyltransferase
MNLAAVILAAGASRRYHGGNKLLVDLGDGPLIRVVTRHALQSAVEDIVVVTGNDRELIEAALEDLPLRFVHNENWRAGVGGSIALGVSSIAATADGSFIVLGDAPFISGALLDSLVDAFKQASGRSIVFPVLPDGAQRNPVLWPREFFPQLVRFRGDKGGKSLLRVYASRCKAVRGFPEIAFDDIDTRVDLCAIRRTSTSGRG